MHVSKPIRLLLMTALATLAPAILVSGDEKAASPQPRMIAIGCVGDFSGPYAAFGTAMRNGVQLAVSRANQLPEPALRFKLYAEDDHGRADEVVGATTRLIERDHVVGIVGEASSAFTKLSAPVCQQHQTPLITPTGSDPDVTSKGSYVFRACATDAQQSRAVAQFARDTLKARSAVILTRKILPDTSASADAFAAAFQQRGGNLAATLTYAPIQKNFSLEIQRIRKAQPDVIFVAGYLPEVGFFASQMQAAGLRTPLLGTDGWRSELQFGDKPDVLAGHHFSVDFANDNPDPRVQEFVKSYSLHYPGFEAQSEAALGYDATGMLLDAIRRANGKAGPDVQLALMKTQNYAGVTGSITVDQARNVVKPVIIVSVARRTTHFKQVVSPAQ